MDLARIIPLVTAADFDGWLRAHGADTSEVVVGIYNRASGRQTVGLLALQEVALCHGWVDTQNQRIDAERYAVRFVPRRVPSTWGPKNRLIARRMVDAGCMTDAGRAKLPDDL